MMENDIAYPVLCPKTHEEVEEWRSRLFVIGSFPRSGSHWLRRMLAEIVALRHGMDGAPFGKVLNQVAGFRPAGIDGEFWLESDCPIFVATHQVKKFEPNPLRVFLRRDFEAVFKSCQKAEKESDKLWFTGNREKVFSRWAATTQYGCLHADLVLDYKMIQESPAAAVRAVYRLADFAVLDEEVDAAVLAGRRGNMLREQEACAKRDWDIINKEDCYA